MKGKVNGEVKRVRKITLRTFDHRHKWRRLRSGGIERSLCTQSENGGGEKTLLTKISAFTAV